MHQLFLFLHRYRSFFIFLLFEGLSAFLIIQNQNYHRAAFFNSSNAVAGSVVEASTNITNYFNLREQNESLNREVAVLKEQLINLQGNEVSPSLSIVDSSYKITPARVVNNSFRQLNNYITLNKGNAQGIAPDQGVISPQGIVGKVRSVSSNYAIVVSLLHTDFLVSSVLSRTSSFCTTNWDGRDPAYADLLYVPRHISVTAGDTVRTSGYNSIFPPDQLIGVVEEVSTLDNATFHDIRIKLTTDFSILNTVSIVEHTKVVEKDSIEQNSAIVN